MKRQHFVVRVLPSAAVFLVSSLAAHAETAQVAVAANFTAVAEHLARDFEHRFDHQVSFSFGSTGALYAQITQEAPFDVLLSADDERPQRAVTEGFGVEGTVFTYAIGRLVLYGASSNGTEAEQMLMEGRFTRLAIAAPEIAPYGAAALQALAALELEEAVRPKLVTGENISQALQFVESGNAELGFVALSQMEGKGEGDYWLVPGELHNSIAQAAVLLKAGKGNAAARAFLDYLKSAEAGAIISAAGYEVP